MSAKKKPRMVENENSLRLSLFDEKNVSAIQELWASDEGDKSKRLSGTVLPDCNVKVIQEPFPVCLVYDAAPKKFIIDALSEIEQLEYLKKSNDLYEFHQTEDVANFKDQPAVKNLHDFVCNEIFKWVEKTFAPDGLNSQVAATFSSYAYGDRLLCHDDKCEDRHIAFVLYLTENWTAKDGGNLELFECDDDGDPIRPVVSIPATFNTLVLFEVSPESYHQVTEILSKTKKRLSLNGWFHKDNLPERPEGPLRIFETIPALACEVKLEEYMFDQYLGFKNQMDIKSTFLQSSEIQLDHFFQPGLVTKLIEEFSSPQVEWNMVGPAHMRHYEVANTATLPPAMTEMLALFQSFTWFKFLRNISGLDLTAYSRSDLSAWEKGIAPSCQIELQRWKPGCYTLIHDEDQQFYIDVLDAIIRFPLNENDEIVHLECDSPESGHILYVDKDTLDDECLLHLGDKMNSLALIFRERGVMRFTKYLNSDANSFYQIQCSYLPWSAPEDDPELKHVESDSDLSEEEEEEEVIVGMSEEDDLSD